MELTKSAVHDLAGHRLARVSGWLAALVAGVGHARLLELLGCRPRRRRDEGSIRKRGSTYTYWLDIGPDPVTGKRRQRTKGGFRTKRECQAALNEAISALRSGTLVQPSRRTVASFLVEEWLPAVRMAGLRDSTWASYRMNVEKHLVPGLGAIELQRLSPA